MSKQRIFMFWGVMDLMYVLGFFYWNLSRGRIPLYDDAVSFMHVSSEYGGSAPILLFIGSLLLSLSIVLTMFMFFRRHPLVRFIACLQIPFRLYLVVPSLSFIPWMANFFELKQAAIVFPLLITSEGLKIVSLRMVHGRARQQGID
jgi:hypothetical protein